MRNKKLVFAVCAPLLAFALILFILSSLPIDGVINFIPSENVFAQSITMTETIYSESKQLVVDPKWLEIVNKFESTTHSIMLIEETSINLDLINGVVAGRTASPVPIAITVTRGITEVGYATAVPTPLDAEFFYGTSIYWQCTWDCDGKFEADDVVWLRQTNNVVSMTIPMFTALAGAGVDGVYGEAPANDPITVYLFPDADETALLTQTVTVNPTGTYLASWAPGYQVKPKDNGYVIYSPDVGRNAYLGFYAPYLQVHVFGTELRGIAPPSELITVTVTEAEGGLERLYTVFSNHRGEFDISPFWDPYSNIDISIYRPGDEIVVTADSQTFSMTVADLLANGDLSNQLIYGSSPPNSQLEVRNFEGPLTNPYYDVLSNEPLQVVTATAAVDGNFEASLPLERGNYGAVYHQSSVGFHTYESYVVPYLSARLGEYRDRCCFSGPMLSGQLDLSEESVTAEIQGLSGYLKNFFMMNTAINGYFEYYPRYNESSVLLETGDVITLSSGHGVALEVVVPNLTALADPEDNTVSGEAPPGSRLTVDILDDTEVIVPPYPPPPPFELSVLEDQSGGGYYVMSQVVTATVHGTYLADFSGLGGFSSRAGGQIRLEGPDGNDYYRPVRVTPVCPPSLAFAQIGGNEFDITTRFNCSGGHILLKDSFGNLKAETEMFEGYGPSSWDFHDETHRPVLILPGDTIEIQSGGTTNAWEIPDLTIIVDTERNELFGQAPPSEMINLALFPVSNYNDPPIPVTTTVGSGGHYSTSLTGLHSLELGDQVRVELDGDVLFYAFGNVPYVNTNLYQSQVTGLSQPLAPFTISMETTRPVEPFVMGYVDTYGHLFTGLFDENTGEDVNVVPGDTVIVTTPNGRHEIPIPFLSVDIDPMSAVFEGVAPSEASLKMTISSEPGQPSQWITATLQGDFQAAFPEIAPIDYVWGRLTHYGAEGNLTTLQFSTPSFNIVLGSTCVNGTMSSPAFPISITHRTASNIEEEVVLDGPEYQNQFSVCFESPVYSGDQLTATSSVEELVYEIPQISAEYDSAREVVEGWAFPNRSVEIFLSSSNFGFVERHVWADEYGWYGVDIRDIILSPFDDGYIYISDEFGNRLKLYFDQADNFYLPAIRKE